MEHVWTTHEDAHGFALEIPAGWQTSSEAGSIRIAGTRSESVMILPLKIEVQLDANRAWQVLLNLSNQFWPQQRWDVPRRDGWQLSPNGVRTIRADESVVRQTNALWWANTGQRQATGFFYSVAAPPVEFKSLEPVFTRILQSFRVTRVEAATSSDPLAGLQFQSWTDPTEMAFSLEVPSGWRTTGGIGRRNFVPLSEFIIQSPDQQVMVRSGDVNVVNKYIVPNPTLMSLGQQVGQMTSDGSLMMPYKTGLEFAVDYVGMTAGRNFPNLQLLSSRDRPDYTQAMSWYAQSLGWAYHTAGEVTYAAQSGGETYVIYQFAETAVTHHSNVATLWNLQSLSGFIAPAERASLADSVLQHAFRSLYTHPQWMMREFQMNQKIAEDNRRYREYSNNLWQQAQAARWASWERVNERRGDILRDLTRVVDPQTGEAYKVQSGSNYYWIDPVNNVIAGTNIPYKPDSDFRAMTEGYD